LTGKLVQTARDSERLHAASSARSARVSLGWEVCRRRIASSWRRMRISSSFERRGRASSQTSASRFRATRYANDQSRKPSLDHQQEHPNLASQNSRGRVCEPYALGQGDISGPPSAARVYFERACPGGRAPRPPDRVSCEGSDARPDLRTPRGRHSSPALLLRSTHSFSSQCAVSDRAALLKTSARLVRRCRR
jgi:hypothetical protein